MLAIAVFGVVLPRTFQAGAESGLDTLHLAASVRTAIDRELPKMAGAELPAGEAEVRVVVDHVRTSEHAVRNQP